MNIVYILEHISEQLHTIVRHFQKNNTECITICKRVDLVDNFECNEQLKNHINLDYELPKILTYENNICYCLITDTFDKYLIGPVLLENSVTIELIFHNDIYICSLDKFLSFVLLLFNTLEPNNITNITKNDIINTNFPTEEIENIVKQKFVSSLFENLENSLKHNSHNKEVRELNSIKNGDVNSLIKTWEEDLAGVHGRLAKNNERQAKNLAITTLILASRAAIDGGLHPEISYTIVDNYIYELEELKDINKITPLMRKAEIHYTELIYELKSTNKNVSFKHPIVESAKDYIIVNIYSTMTIKSIASELNINANYLATLFKKQENISIPDYILREKINIARNLLIYSNSSYIEITTNLGFSSQSHFTQKFREMTGITPKKFRNLYGLKIK